MLELVVVLALVALLLAVTVQPMHRLVDRLAVNGAASDAAAAFATARHLAISRGVRAAVTIDERRALLRVTVQHDTTVRPLGEIHGVTLESTRDSMAYTPLGLGFGGANFRLVFRRGRAAESLYVSRLGRVRH